MHKLSAATVAAIIAAVGLLPAAAAAEEVTITGCPQPGVEAGCIVMSAAGALYNITAAKPTPVIGVAGKVTGTGNAGAVSLCGQGNVLSAATWTTVPGIDCTVLGRG